MSLLIPRPKIQLTVDLKRKIFIGIDRIIMLEASGNYTLIHLKDGTNSLFAKCINAFEDELNAQGFLRVHKSYIINPKYVVKYISKDNTIIMDNNLYAPISRRKMSMIKSSSIRKIVGKYTK
ncbi:MULTISPECIES: LytTR family DNA-binding domain-containing protein [unclassified Arcicella]|uniref:LytR/AlgR family response regulator transcription factor n=1 Tax=unclassified Arcicella TaxID=2644986 RepID=UPI002860730B|nr:MULTISPECIES: LytTR family DNA-binding domain-containing protein [unclassified Arcicella]MDR6560004.1 two-component system LytT family response regulator [Arcicella sp. BE51]MDR6810389.1 two-component system LytT family response regulator [Arcicella sp. BE140]MDR6821739.1 two-component system LytT family response regulator [Arcicella sp. BE139]